MRNVGRSVGPILTLGQKHQRGVIRRARASMWMPLAAACTQHGCKAQAISRLYVVPGRYLIRWVIDRGSAGRARRLVICLFAFVRWRSRRRYI